jgi:hypothetical protein
MATPGKKSSCVLEYHTSKFVVTVQRAFRVKYAKDPPTDKTILVWYKHFTETGCLADLKARIIAAVKNIDAPMLTRVWQELEYRMDVCRVTRGAHIKHLRFVKKKKNSFPAAVNNSIRAGPLVFLLYVFVITENIMKHPVYTGLDKTEFGTSPFHVQFQKRIQYFSVYFRRRSICFTVTATLPKKRETNNAVSINLIQN